MKLVGTCLWSYLNSVLFYLDSQKFLLKSLSADFKAQLLLKSLKEDLKAHHLKSLRADFKAHHLKSLRAELKAQFLLKSLRADFKTHHPTLSDVGNSMFRFTKNEDVACEINNSGCGRTFSRHETSLAFSLNLETIAEQQSIQGLLNKVLDPIVTRFQNINVKWKMELVAIKRVTALNQHLLLT